MLYLVEARAGLAKAHAIDAGEGPGPVFAKIAERFHPEAFYGRPLAGANKQRGNEFTTRRTLRATNAINASPQAHPEF
jgi:hypothetical protein